MSYKCVFSIRSIPSELNAKGTPLLGVPNHLN